MDDMQMRMPEGINQNSDIQQRLLVTAKQAAKLCGKSLRTWWAWDSAGWIPRPVRIGRSTLWRFDEIQAWVKANCPHRDQWEAMQS